MQIGPIALELVKGKTVNSSYGIGFRGLAFHGVYMPILSPSGLAALKNNANLAKPVYQRLKLVNAGLMSNALPFCSLGGKKKKNNLP